MKRLLFVASEAYPLIKTGGLADVAGSLPEVLRQQGMDVRLLLPAYQHVLEAIAPPDLVAHMEVAGTALRILATRLPGTQLETWLGGNLPVVRIMPNTPALLGAGASGLFANARVSVEQKNIAGMLFEATGICAWISDEAQMDTVTALSGSGPAYVFLLVECLAAAGVDAGLPADLAERLARATVAGAGELLHRSDEPAETLRRNVTSPGGTTAAALEVLMGSRGLRPLMTAAVEAARKRSRELAE